MPRGQNPALEMNFKADIFHPILPLSLCPHSLMMTSCCFALRRNHSPEFGGINLGPLNSQVVSTPKISSLLTSIIRT